MYRVFTANKAETAEFVVNRLDWMRQDTADPGVLSHRTLTGLTEV